MKNQNIGLWSKIKFFIADTGKQLAIAIVIVLFLRTTIIEPFKIPSGSMIPTLFIGDHIFVNKMAYGLNVPFTEMFFDNPMQVIEKKAPQRGDVIVFKYPKDKTMNYIKRVVGVPGDVVQIRDRVLYINNKEIVTKAIKDTDLVNGLESEDDKSLFTLFEEDLVGIKHPVFYNMNSLLNADYGPVEVPQGQLLCFGDNRDKSSDSRAWGFVPVEYVKGKAEIIWLSFQLSIENQFKVHFRPERIGKKNSIIIVW